MNLRHNHSILHDVKLLSNNCKANTKKKGKDIFLNEKYTNWICILMPKQLAMINKQVKKQN